jgi:hypothetical protein
MQVYIWRKIGSSKSVYLFRGRPKSRSFGRMEETKGKRENERKTIMRRIDNTQYEAKDTGISL